MKLLLIVILGQIEGGLMMGLGWIKSEDRTWGKNGTNETGTWHYKAPMHLDIPKNFSAILTNKAPEFEKQPNDNYPGTREIVLISGQFLIFIFFRYPLYLSNRSMFKTSWGSINGFCNVL